MRTLLWDAYSYNTNKKIVKFKSIMHINNRLVISHRCNDTYPWSKEQVKTLMENSLISLIAKAEALQKLVCKTHHLMHPNITFLQTLQARTINNYTAINLIPCSYNVHHPVLHPIAVNHHLFSDI